MDQQSPVRSHPRFNYRTMGFAGTVTGGYAEHQLLPDWRPTLIPGTPQVWQDASVLRWHIWGD